MPENAPRSEVGQTCLIVGAGIIGASIAFRLARSGCQVTLIDAVGPHAGASGRSWAWINAIAADTPSYVALRRAGIDAYHRLEQDLSGRLEVDWSGSIVWDSALFDPDADYAGRQDLRRVDSTEIRTLEPMLAAPPAAALYSPDDGLIDGAHATGAILAAAAEAGARTVYGLPADGVIVEKSRAVGVTCGDAVLRADTTILCAGTGTADLLASLGRDLPMQNRPGLLVMTRPVSAKLSRAIWTETTHVKQLRDGRLLIGESAHRDGALHDPEKLAAAMLQDAGALLPGCAPLQLERYTVATRPIPADGYPVIGPVDGLAGLYVATMHSGMTLAAIVGELVSEEVIRGESRDMLAAFRPGRFPGMIRKD